MLFPYKTLRHNTGYAYDLCLRVFLRLCLPYPLSVSIDQPRHIVEPICISRFGSPVFRLRLELVCWLLICFPAFAGAPVGASCFVPRTIGETATEFALAVSRTLLPRACG